MRDYGEKFVFRPRVRFGLGAGGLFARQRFQNLTLAVVALLCEFGNPAQHTTRLPVGAALDPSHFADRLIVAIAVAQTILDLIALLSPLQSRRDALLRLRPVFRMD